jgi:hypothetical protein
MATSSVWHVWTYQGILDAASALAMTPATTVRFRLLMLMEMVASGGGGGAAALDGGAGGIKLEKLERRLIAAHIRISSTSCSHGLQ